MTYPFVKRAIAGAAASGLIAAFAVTSHGTAQAAGSACVPRWHAVTRTPSISDIDALAPSDVWAIGGGLAIHWDGKKTGVTKLPNEGFSAISARSPRDVWAVGGDIEDDASTPLAAHWNGKKWRSVPLPLLDDAQLNDVVAVGPSNVWAVGDTDVLNESRPLIVHWNGRQWQEVRTGVRTEPGSVLVRIAASGANDIWAVGGDRWTDLVLHWDGRRWNQVNSPEPAGMATAVAVAPSGDAWTLNGDRDTGNSAFVHWKPNGSATVYPDRGGFLYGLTAAAANDVWAVGERSIVHYNGKTWRETNPFGEDANPWTAILYAVDAVSPSDIWTGGANGRLLRYSCTGRR